jgi:hypothetical protein
MNKLTKFMIFAALGGALTANQAFAHGPFAQQQQPAQAGAQSAQDDQEKIKLYEEWRNNRKTDQKRAYEAGKQFLEKYPNDEYAPYVKKFVDAYEAELKKIEKGKELESLAKMVQEKKYSEAFTQGKQICAKEPDNLFAHLQTSWAAFYGTLGNVNINKTEAIPITKKAIELVEQNRPLPDGKTLDEKTKNDSLNWLNVALGYYLQENNPAEASKYLYTAMKYEGVWKKDPQTYALLANTIERSDLAKVSEHYQKNFAGKAESPEQKAALAEFQAVADRVIDAYARAVALAASDPKFGSAKQQWQQRLTEVYKARNDDKTEGLNELIASVLSKPMPEPKPLTLPTPSASPTTAPSTTGTTSTPPNQSSSTGGRP